MSVKLIHIVGARPQFMKLAPLSREISDYNESSSLKVQECIVHTGQHYDKGMSDVFFEELKIPEAQYNLGIGSGTHGVQTAGMLEGIEKVVLKERPDAVIVYGDTNSTLAGALAAVKLHVPAVHIESGLRSFNRQMPEEINRIAADHICDLLLAPTPTAVSNLKNEGLLKVTRRTGDIMFDTVLFNRQIALDRSQITTKLGLSKFQYGLVTLHRAENTDSVARLVEILQGLNDIAASGLQLVFPVHPRTIAAIKRQLPEWQPHQNLKMLEPVGYLEMLQLLDGARLVLTDSGGLQKEAFFLERPCITFRDETEWVETVTAKANCLTGANAANMVAAARAAIDISGMPHYDRNAFGDGHAAKETLQIILELLGKSH